MEFKKCKSLFDSDKIFELLNSNGIIWLKLRAISRKVFLENFAKINNIKLNKTKVNDIFEELYKILINNKETNFLLDTFIKNNSIILNKNEEEKLVSELHKLKYFDWGGDYKNALDKFIVDKYIKKYSSFNEIQNKLDNEITSALDGYVKCSWYNHWSTILIENIFKSHKKIISAIGNIKKIDFFIEDIPFDLKTTYLPVNFIETKRKEFNLNREIIEYKNIAKKYFISYGINSSDKNIIYEIREKSINSNNKNLIEEIKNIDNFRINILKECIKNPKELILNFYEEQGEMRFDASNRLFLVLVDINNFDESWKLKRNIDFLKNNIFNYLNDFNKDNITNNPILFNYKNHENSYKVFSDIIFIIKE